MEEEDKPKLDPPEVKPDDSKKEEVISPEKARIQNVKWVLDKFAAVFRNDVTLTFTKQGPVMKMISECFTMVLDLEGTKEKYFIQILPETTEGILWRGWKYDTQNHILFDYGFEWKNEWLECTHMAEDLDGLKCFSRMNLAVLEPGKTYDEIIAHWPRGKEEIFRERDYPVFNICFEPKHGKYDFMVQQGEDPVTYSQWVNSRFNTSVEDIYIQCEDNLQKHFYKEGVDFTNLKHDHAKVAFKYLLDDFVKAHKDIKTIRFNEDGSELHEDWEFFTLVLKTPDEEEKYFIQTLPNHDGTWWRGWKFDDKNHLLTDSRHKWGYDFLGTEYSLPDLDGLRCFSKARIGYFYENKTYLEVKPTPYDRNKWILRERNYPVLTVKLEPDKEKNRITYYMKEDPLTYEHYINSRFAPKPSKMYSARYNTTTPSHTRRQSWG